MKSTFYFKPETVSRGKAQTVLHAIAYITSQPIRCFATGDVYRRRSAQEVLARGLHVPQSIDRPDLTSESLWNAVKQREVRSNSVEARQLVVGLPIGISREQQESIAGEIAAYLVQRYGVPVEWALHAPHPDGDPRNFHLHLVLGTRRVKPDGTFGPKTRELDDLYGNDWSAIRKHVATVFDRFPHEADLPDDEPTRGANDEEWQPSIHEGPAVTDMERRGIRTRRRAKNEEIKASNAAGAARSAECASLRHRIRRLEALEAGLLRQYLAEVMPPVRWPQLTDRVLAVGLPNHTSFDEEIVKDRPRPEE